MEPQNFELSVQPGFSASANVQPGTSASAIAQSAQEENEENVVPNFQLPSLSPAFSRRGSSRNKTVYEQRQKIEQKLREEEWNLRMEV